MGRIKLTGVLTDSTGIDLVDRVCTQVQLRSHLNQLSTKRKNMAYVLFGDAVTIMVLHYMCDDLGRSWNRIGDFVETLPKRMYSELGQAASHHINRDVIQDAMMRIVKYGIAPFLATIAPRALSELKLVDSLCDKIAQGVELSEQEKDQVYDLSFHKISAKRIQGYLEFFAQRRNDLQELFENLDYLPLLLGSSGLDVLRPEERKETLPRPRKGKKDISVKVGEDGVVINAANEQPEDVVAANAALGVVNPELNPEAAALAEEERKRARMAREHGAVPVENVFLRNSPTDPYTLPSIEELKEVNADYEQHLVETLSVSDIAAICGRHDLKVIMRLPDNDPMVRAIKERFVNNELQFQRFEVTNSIVNYEQARATTKVLPIYTISGAWAGNTTINGQDFSLLFINAKELRMTYSSYCLDFARREQARLQRQNKIILPLGATKQDVEAVAERIFSKARWCRHTLKTWGEVTGFSSVGRPARGAIPQAQFMRGVFDITMDPLKIKSAVDSELYYVLAVSNGNSGAKRPELTMKQIYDIYHCDFGTECTSAHLRKQGSVSRFVTQTSTRRLTALTVLLHYTFILQALLKSRLQLTALSAAASSSARKKSKQDEGASATESA